MCWGLPCSTLPRLIFSFFIQPLEIMDLRFPFFPSSWPLKLRSISYALAPPCGLRGKVEKQAASILGSLSVINSLEGPSGFCCLLQSERKWDLLLNMECLLQANLPAEKSGSVVGPIWTKQRVMQKHKTRLLLFYYLNWIVSTFHRWLGSARELGIYICCYCKMLS